eukprot:COSAG01_NODE_32080_length_586_cov_5.061602_1_plen_79_part_00
MKKEQDSKKRKHAKQAAKIAKEKAQVLDFDTAMANCGLWIEDEHVYDPSEVNEVTYVPEEVVQYTSDRLTQIFYTFEI